MYFLFSKAGKFKTSMARVPYNKLLTNLASSSHTGEYWPSVVFVRTSLRSVLGPVFPSTALPSKAFYILYLSPVFLNLIWTGFWRYINALLISITRHVADLFLIPDLLIFEPQSREGERARASARARNQEAREELLERTFRKSNQYHWLLVTGNFKLRLSRCSK